MTHTGLSVCICVYKAAYIRTAGRGQMCKGTSACLSTRHTGAYMHKGAALHPCIGIQGERVCLSAYVPISASVCAAIDVCTHTCMRTCVLTGTCACACLHPYRYLTV